jgi:hypothetical protein
MPVHDWTRVLDGTFHHFHVTWIPLLSRTLNRGVLPEGYYAMAEQVVGVVPDVLTLQYAEDDHAEDEMEPPGELSEGAGTALLASAPRPTPRDPQGIHGVISKELGAKEEYLAPPDKPLTLASNPGYCPETAIESFVEPLAVGDQLPAMPLFLAPQSHVMLPLESSYMEAVADVPARARKPLEA